MKNNVMKFLCGILLLTGVDSFAKTNAKKTKANVDNTALVNAIKTLQQNNTNDSKKISTKKQSLKRRLRSKSSKKRLVSNKKRIRSSSRKSRKTKSPVNFEAKLNTAIQNVIEIANKNKVDVEKHTAEINEIKKQHISVLEFLRDKYLKGNDADSIKGIDALLAKSKNISICETAKKDVLVNPVVVNPVPAKTDVPVDSANAIKAIDDLIAKAKLDAVNFPVKAPVNGNDDINI